MTSLTEFQTSVARAVRDAFAGRTATAAKRGRHTDRPYVPVVRYESTDGTARTSTRQITGRAFATRAEAIEYAQRALEYEKHELAHRLCLPSHRAEREQHGLSREIDVPPDYDRSAQTADRSWRLDTSWLDDALTLLESDVAG